MNPIIKWPGGKRWLRSHLRQAYASAWADRTWVEPFAGGLAMAFHLLPQRVVANDANPHLINFYRWVAAGMGDAPFPLKNDREHYYACRQRFNDLIAAGDTETREAAWLFYYLNRTGYNGLVRFNRAGQYNVPFGRYARIDYRTDFSEWQPFLARWTLCSGDFTAVRAEPGACIYADPPYDGGFTQYAAGGFSWEDQERLVRWLDGHDGPVLVSNAATERVLGLYRRWGYTIHVMDGPRCISRTGDRTPAREVLAIRDK